MLLNVKTLLLFLNPGNWSSTRGLNASGSPFSAHDQDSTLGKTCFFKVSGSPDVSAGASSSMLGSGQRILKHFEVRPKGFKAFWSRPGFILFVLFVYFNYFYLFLFIFIYFH